MEWLVYEWTEAGMGSRTDFREFAELEDAKAYADRRARYYKVQGIEFDVRIYQLTNY